MLDIEAAMAKLDDNAITSDVVKDMFAGLSEKAKASAARVESLPSALLSVAELERWKERLQAKLEHLRSAQHVFALNSGGGKD